MKGQLHNAAGLSLYLSHFTNRQGGDTMNELKNTSQPQQEPTSTFSMEIDGRIYTVRTFFKDACAETMQQKIERMIRRDLLAYNPLTA